jgi:hypothetical protein
VSVSHASTYSAALQHRSYKCTIYRQARTGQDFDHVSIGARRMRLECHFGCPAISARPEIPLDQPGNTYLCSSHATEPVLLVTALEGIWTMLCCEACSFTQQVVVAQTHLAHLALALLEWLAHSASLEFACGCDNR